MSSNRNSPESSRQEKLKTLLRDMGPALGSLAVILVIICGVVYLVWQTKDTEPVISVGKDELKLMDGQAAAQGKMDGATAPAAQQPSLNPNQQNIPSQPNLPENNPAASDTTPSAEEASRQLIESKLNSIDSQFSGLSSSQLKTDDISDSALGL